METDEFAEGRRGATVNYYYGAVRCLLNATLRLYKIPLPAVSYYLSYSINTFSSSLNISPLCTNLTFFHPDSIPIPPSANSIPSQFCFRFLPSYSPLSPPYYFSTNLLLLHSILFPLHPTLFPFSKLYSLRSQPYLLYRISTNSIRSSSSPYLLILKHSESGSYGVISS